MTEQKNFTGTFFLGTMIGALAGSITALLIAPRSGEETQQKITEKREELRREAEKRIDESRHFTVEKFTEARNAVADWLAARSEILTDKSAEINAGNGAKNRTRPKEKTVA